MDRFRMGVVVVAGALVLGAAEMFGAGESAPPPKPAPPAPTVPDLATSDAAVICIGCDKPFDMSTHKKVLAGLLSNPYIGELRQALYLQDTWHQFESKVHFDNCDFDDAIAYIGSLQDEADGHVQAARTAQQAGNADTTDREVRKAFFALGQALHAIQDFYAHSNYVELQAPMVKRVTDLEIIAPWRPQGQERIAELRKDGLVSGFVFWGVPQRCPSGAKSHGELAKDNEGMTSGAIRVEPLQNMSQHQIARYLAREASVEFLADAFVRWPLLQEMNGANVPIEVLIDRRGL